MTIKQDRNFDTLIDRFEQKVYDTAKGEWRLKLLKEDLADLYHASRPLNIWDAGCGFAQLSLWFAEQGHELSLCDVSGKMLARAEANFQAAGLTANFYQQSAQSLAPSLPQFDVVLCHAVLEWLAQPLESLTLIANQVKPAGYLSLLFYNHNAMIYKNVLRGAWRWQHILDGRYLGKGKNLTPPNPQFPHVVRDHLAELGFSVKIQTGIRVFHDYLSNEVMQESEASELFALEYSHCRLPTFRDMGRYIHVLVQR